MLSSCNFEDYIKGEDASYIPLEEDSSVEKCEDCIKQIGFETECVEFKEEQRSEFIEGRFINGCIYSKLKRECRIAFDDCLNNVHNFTYLLKDESDCENENEECGFATRVIEEKFRYEFPSNNLKAQFFECYREARLYNYTEKIHL